ncbi:iron chelate uptake ABC transporter family permease subunit, partial [Pseudomonas aeruginosa]
QAMYAQLWLAGSLNTRTWSHVVPAALGLLASVPLALYHGRRLEVLELGDASAAQLQHFQATTVVQRQRAAG